MTQEVRIQDMDMLTKTFPRQLTSVNTALQQIKYPSLNQQKSDKTADQPAKMPNKNIIQLQEQQLRDSDADLQAEEQMNVDLYPRGKTEPESATITTTNEVSCPYQYVPLRMGGNGGSHKPSEASRALLEYEVSFDDLKRMTHKFYELAFQDDTLDTFIRSHNDPHGDRFAKWIHQKLTGSNIWDEDRRTRDLTPHEVAGGRATVVHDRSSAHVAAWHSVKRPANQVGRHFTLEECRVWMRLHFWALRSSGLLEQSPSFADYYIRFIGHFVAVYERSATVFARESFRWSENPENTELYIANGRKMTDVLGVRFHDALKDIPDEELDQEGEWPYHVAEQ